MGFCRFGAVKRGRIRPHLTTWGSEVHAGSGRSQRDFKCPGRFSHATDLKEKRIFLQNIRTAFDLERNEKMQTTTIETRRNPGCLLQILWFAFIGVWLGELWVAAAWILIVTIIGLPIGIAMLNKVPKIMALREPESVVRITTRPDGQIQENPITPRQVPFILRALYFILIGWWLSALWIEAAYALCMTIVGLPLGFWMFDRVPGLLTLKRQ